VPAAAAVGLSLRSRIWSLAAALSISVSAASIWQKKGRIVPKL
jgi:hypothetical protein